MDRYILTRYFLGQSPEVEKEEIRQWLETDEVNRQVFINERIRFDASLLVDEQALARKKYFHLSPRIVRYVGIAASVLFLLGGFYAYDSYRNEQLLHAIQTVYVPVGNRTNIILPDGTSVWLNANTTLRYPIAFSSKNREIILNGEAYFEVVKDKKPFIVKTDKYNVEVLGTTFNVEAYADKPAFRTMLYNGKVKLYNSTDPETVFLSPGQTAQLVGGRLEVSSTTDGNSCRWKDGLIYIENKSFDAVMELFEKFYDVRIVVNNQKVGDLGYHGKLRISDGVDHALRVLQNDFPFTYKRDEETNTIYIN